MLDHHLFVIIFLFEIMSNLLKENHPQLFSTFPRRGGSPRSSSRNNNSNTFNVNCDKIIRFKDIVDTNRWSFKQENRDYMESIIMDYKWQKQFEKNFFLSD